MPRFTISDHYLKFRPAAIHAASCKRSGTDVWEVARLDRPRLRSEDSGGEYVETTIRLICRDCGVVKLMSGDVHTNEGATTETTGFGSKPTQADGLWLHAGPRRFADDDLDPEVYYVTASKTPPDDVAHVIGLIGWTREWKGSGYGPVRWYAVYGRDEDGSEVAPAGAPRTEGLRSKRAAVRWINERRGIAVPTAAQ